MKGVGELYTVWRRTDIEFRIVWRRTAVWWGQNALEVSMFENSYEVVDLFSLIRNRISQEVSNE